MEHHTLKLSNDVVFRKVKDELITIHTRTGEFHYFTSEAEAFLSFFSQPASLEEFYEAAGLAGAKADAELERKYLSDFLARTIELGILQNTDGTIAPDSTKRIKSEYSRPQYLRRGEKNLDEVTFAFLYP